MQEVFEVSQKALLVLEDGSYFWGKSCGATGEAFGELVFSTSQTGYLETLTDPSYAGQICVLTQPLIGNYGVDETLVQSSAKRPHLSALVVSDMCKSPSHYSSMLSFPKYLEHTGIVAIEAVNTRKITHILRECGCLRAAVSTQCDDPQELFQKVCTSAHIENLSLVSQVSCKTPHRLSSRASSEKRVVVLDFGCKEAMLSCLLDAGLDLVVLPSTATFLDIMSERPDGIFLSNGPGDPAQLTQQIELVSALLDTRIPLFGICLGHQLISLALGGTTQKMRFGHHGSNEAVHNLLDGSCETTSQNHNYMLVASSLGASDAVGIITHPSCGRMQIAYTNLNDDSVEGLILLDRPCMSVQFHPESTPGTHDSRYLFDAFAALIAGASSKDAILSAKAKTLRRSA